MNSSTVETLSTPINDLFTLLTDAPDELLRWTTHKYPAHVDILRYHPDGMDIGIEGIYKNVLINMISTSGYLIVIVSVK